MTNDATDAAEIPAIHHVGYETSIRLFIVDSKSNLWSNAYGVQGFGIAACLCNIV